VTDATNPYTGDVAGARSSGARLASRRVAGIEFGALASWAAIASVLSLVTGRVADWNAMTDELVYEHLGLAVSQLHSPLPHLHGELVRSLAQLYPLLISPWLASGYIPHDLHQVHVFNAWLMTSACIPAYLLARRVSGRQWVAYTMLALTAGIPWILYSTVLLTEVAAYPAFLWAVLAMEKAVAAPSRRNDALVVVALTVAFFARTQFLMLVGVLVAALVVHYLFRRDAGASALVRDHVVLWSVLAALAAAALGVRLSGHSLIWLSVYGSQLATGYIPPGTAGLVAPHAANLAFGTGILPFVVGVGWLLANVVRPPASRDLHAFACIGAAAVVIVVPAITAWDLRIGHFVLDRYLYYLVPVALLAFVCALLDPKRPRWSLLLPAAVVIWGFLARLQETFLWSGPLPLSTDSPGAWLYRPIADLGGGGTRGASAILAVLTVLVVALFLVAERRLRPDVLTRAAVALLLVGMPVYTVLTFDKLLSRNGHSSRPLTLSQSGRLDWLDRLVGTDARVTQVPYPISTSFYVSLQFWRDLEFWNKSVRYSVHYPTDDVYADAVIWFPNNRLAFDPRTGRASATLSPYVVASVGETRFRLAGDVQLQRADAMLIRTRSPWRAEWLTSGLYDDGWSRPGRPVRLRVFAVPGQDGAARRLISLHFSPPDGVAKLDYAISSNVGLASGSLAAGGEAHEAVEVCVPAGGFADVVLTTPNRSRIPGDLRSREYLQIPREGGLLLQDVSLADEVLGRCSA
jgi:hypothetical protein